METKDMPLIEAITKANEKGLTVAFFPPVHDGEICRVKCINRLGSHANFLVTNEMASAAPGVDFVVSWHLRMTAFKYLQITIE